ncbi:MAG: hypothetical protein AMXMBFR55_18150 [Gemmatimonadota bacterium]
MTENRHLTQLARIALLVTIGDLATKAAAMQFLAGDATSFAPWLRFAVVHNDQGAFGWSIGVYTWQVNLALTLAAIVLMVPVSRDLARVDRSAPRALGLIVGGALGNFASLVTSPYGVVDFIELDFTNLGVALNVADVAAYAGLAMILRTGGLLVAALWRDVRVHELRHVTEVRDVFAEKALIEEGMYAAPRRNASRVDREVAVADWSHFVRPAGVPLGDETPAEEADILEIRTTPGRLGVVGEISPRRGVMGDEHPRVRDR